MSSPQTAQAVKPFMGLPYEDPETMLIARRLIIVAFVDFGLYILNVVVSIAVYGTAVFTPGSIGGVIIAFLLPMCAYYGARDQSEGLLGCLACCSG
jgi:hypothetical protein